MAPRRVDPVGPFKVQGKHVRQLSEAKFRVGPEQQVRTEERTNLRLHAEQKYLGAESNSDVSTSVPTPGSALNLAGYLTHRGRRRGSLARLPAIRGVAASAIRGVAASAIRGAGGGLHYGHDFNR